MAEYVSPVANFSNVFTEFDVPELTSTYGATAKLYKPDGTLLTTVVLLYLDKIRRVFTKQ